MGGFRDGGDEEEFRPFIRRLPGEFIFSGLVVLQLAFETGEAA